MAARVKYPTSAAFPLWAGEAEPPVLHSGLLRTVSAEAYRGNRPDAYFYDRQRRMLKLAWPFPF